MFSNVLRALGTISTLVFAVTGVWWLLKKPESRALPWWLWPLLLFGMITLTIGNTGTVRAYLLIVTGGVAVLALMLGFPEGLRVLREASTPEPTSWPDSQGRPRPKAEDGLPNWKAGHEELHRGDNKYVVRLWVRSTDVSDLGTLGCDVQDPDGEILHRTYINERTRGRDEAVFPPSFSTTYEPKDGPYQVVWSGSRGFVIKRDSFSILDGRLANE
jgi:hypothetical protein